jgi:hypothetical protein
MKYIINGRNRTYLFKTKDNKVTWIDVKEIATHYDNLEDALKDAKEFGGYTVSRLKNY